MDSAIPSAPLASHSESDWEGFGRADLPDSFGAPVLTHRGKDLGERVTIRTPTEGIQHRLDVVPHGNSVSSYGDTEQPDPRDYGIYTFSWEHPAEEFFVIGSFDEWKKLTKLDRADGVFRRTVELPIAYTQYQFVVDVKLDHQSNSAHAERSVGHGH